MVRGTEKGKRGGRVCRRETVFQSSRKCRTFFKSLKKNTLQIGLHFSAFRKGTERVYIFRIRRTWELAFGLYALPVQIEQVLCISLDFRVYLSSSFILWHYCKFTRYI